MLDFVNVKEYFEEFKNVNVDNLSDEKISDKRKDDYDNKGYDIKKREKKIIRDFNEFKKKNKLHLDFCFTYDVELVKKLKNANYNYNDDNDFLIPKSIMISDLSELKYAKEFDFILLDCQKSDKIRENLRRNVPLIVINPEKNSKMDAIDFRNSGLDEVSIKSMYETNKIYGINLSNFFNYEFGSFFWNGLFGRIAQNVMLCRKYNVPVVIMSLANNPLYLRQESDLKSFLILLGLEPDTASKSIHFFDNV